MEHISTTRRGGASTTGAIPIYHICIGEGNNVGSSNGSGNADDSIVASSSSSYWGRTTKRTKEDILQCRVVCVKSKRGPKGSGERDINHANVTKALSQTFGAVKHFVPKKSEGGSESTKYTDIQA